MKERKIFNRKYKYKSKNTLSTYVLVQHVFIDVNVSRGEIWCLMIGNNFIQNKYVTRQKKVLRQRLCHNSTNGKK